jgi:hypothetical protein
VFGTKLPKCMHFKHGAYYLVKQARWIPLGRDMDEALKQYAELTTGIPRTYYKEVYWRAQNNARHRGIEFLLTKEEFDVIVHRARGACEFTKIPFAKRNDTTSRRAPFAPSLDRIDCKLPYQASNCRLIAVCVNAALSDWGDATFKIMVRAAQVI